MVNIIDINSENLKLLNKTKNTNITIYTFFPFRKLNKKEKECLIKNNKSKKKKRNSKKCIKTKRLSGCH
jgi:hypothetical protein